MSNILKLETMEHNKIITKTAKKLFKPYDVKQKGRSRTFIDDNGWYIIVIEFQPSKWDKGIYLNVGINFNWYIQEYFSFDIGYRENVFEKFIGEKQFTEHITNLCKKAIEKIIEYRNDMRSIKNAEKIILKHKFTSDEFWGNYHKGIISGLVGNIDNLNKYFQKILDKNDENINWISELKNRTSHLKMIANNDINNFNKEIIEIIKKTRIVKKLSEKTDFLYYFA